MLALKVHQDNFSPNNILYSFKCISLQYKNILSFISFNVWHDFEICLVIKYIKKILPTVFVIKVTHNFPLLVSKGNKLYVYTENTVNSVKLSNLCNHNMTVVFRHGDIGRLNAFCCLPIVPDLIWFCLKVSFNTCWNIL